MNESTKYVTFFIPHSHALASFSFLAWLHYDIAYSYAWSYVVCARHILYSTMAL